MLTMEIPGLDRQEVDFTFALTHHEKSTHGDEMTGDHFQISMSFVERNNLTVSIIISQVLHKIKE